MRRKRGSDVGSKRKPHVDKSEWRMPWKDKALWVFAITVATGLFGLPGIADTMNDYAIQKYPVMATQSGVVTEVRRGRGTSTRVSYTTNTGESVDALLCGGFLITCGNFKKGDVVKLKYVSDYPGNAYVSDYEPRYFSAMFFGSLSLLIATAGIWGFWKEWCDRTRRRRSRR